MGRGGPLVLWACGHPELLPSLKTMTQVGFYHISCQAMSGHIIPAQVCFRWLHIDNGVV